MIFGPVDAPIPEVDLSEQRLTQMLVDIKRNSRNRRIAMFAPLVLAAAVVGAMIAAPPQHGGLAMVADAEAPDPELPRVFGSNGVWRLAEPIEDGPVADAGPASIVEAPAAPDAPDFELSPPDEEDLNSLPTSTSTPPTSTSGQLPADPTELDVSAFGAEIRIEPAVEEAASAGEPAADAAEAESDQAVLSDSTASEVDPSLSAAGADADSESSVDDSGEAVDDTLMTDVVEAEDGVQAEAVAEAEPTDAAVSPESADAAETDVAAAFEPADARTEEDPVAPAETGQVDTTPEDNQAPDDVTVAETPQIESADSAEANPSTPAADDLNPAEVAPFSTPATITPQSVLVYSAHVSVMVQVVDDDSSVIDWCTTRVDWGDGSVTRVAGADDAALCTASCEYEATSSASSNDAVEGRPEAGGIDVIMQFEHDYTSTIDASPRIFVATGDGCSYTLAELQLTPFTVVPLS